MLSFLPMVAQCLWFGLFSDSTLSAMMSTQYHTNTFHSTKRRRPYEISTVVIPMDDDRADIPDELPVAVVKPCSFTETFMYQAIKPLLVSCFVAGLLSCKRLNKKGFRKFLTITSIYSTLVLIILIAQAIRCLTIFEKTEQFGSMLFFKVVYIAWTMEALGHFVGFYVASCVHDRLRKFFTEWEKIREVCPESRASTIKLASICTAIVWILVMFFVGFNAYLANCTDSLSILLTPLNKEHPYATVVIVLNLIAKFYLNFAWITPSALMFLFCKALTTEFNQINQTIKDHSKKGPIILIRELEGIRQQHNKLCALVGYADNLFSMQIAGSFVGSVFMTCVILYILMMGDSDTVLTTTHALYLLTAVMKMLIDCISGAMVNEAVSHQGRFC